MPSVIAGMDDASVGFADIVRLDELAGNAMYLERSVRITGRYACGARIPLRT